MLGQVGGGLGEGWWRVRRGIGRLGEVYRPYFKNADRQTEGHGKV